MLTTIISLLISLGLLISPADWDNLSAQEQQDMTEIVIDDVIIE